MNCAASMHDMGHGSSMRLSVVWHTKRPDSQNRFQSSAERQLSLMGATLLCRFTVPCKERPLARTSV